MQVISFDALQGMTGRMVVLSLFHSLWIGLCAASLVALSFQARPRLSHQSRYQTLLISLLLTAVAPVVLAVLQYAFANSRDVKIIRQVANVAVVSDASRLGVTRPAGDRQSTDQMRTHDQPAGLFRSVFSGAVSHSVNAVRRFHLLLLVGWLLGAFAYFGLLAMGTHAVYRMCREAQPASQAVFNTAAKLARRARLKQTPKVLVHPEVSEPCLCGLFRPVIMLPESWIERSQRESLDAILAHELAHARRADHLVNLGQRFMEVVFCLSPAVHWLSSSLRRQREFCADALAVRLTHDPLALARALESVASNRQKFRKRPVTGTALGGQTFSLLPRIQELLGMMPTHTRPRLWPFAAMPAAGVVALIATVSGLSQQPPDTSINVARVDTSQNVRTEGSSAQKPPLTEPDSEWPATASQPPHSDRQICYDVRFIDMNATTWRDVTKARARPVKQNGEISAWIFERKAVADVLLCAQNDNATNIVQAPKVTSFEYAPATISTNMQYYESVLEKLDTRQARAMLKQLKTQSPPAAKSDVANNGVGSVVHVTGKFLPDGTRMFVELRDTARRPASDEPLDAAIRATDLVEHEFRVTCGVPDGSSLAISIGLDQRLSQPGSAAIRGKSAEGPRIEAKGGSYARLVLITPRRIVLAAEEMPISGTKGGFGATPRTR